MQGGIDDVGLGVLFGLELYKYEFAGLLMHAEHLEAVYGVGPHTISVPRIKHADDIDPSAFDNGISDEIFAKICALIRIAVPYTGMIISTRESQQVREKVIRLGVSQVSGASRTSVGGYTEEERPTDTEQFDVSDQRTLDEVVRLAHGIGVYPVVLHRLLPGRPYRRPVYVPVQNGPDSKLLPSQCTDDAAGIFTGLCVRRNPQAGAKRVSAKNLRKSRKRKCAKSAATIWKRSGRASGISVSNQEGGPL